MNHIQPPPILFLDFDGTITCRDAIDLILDNFADERWLAIEEQWQANRIGSRDCLTAQMALVRASESDLNELLDTIKLDEGFIWLLEVCRQQEIPVHIISDGFDYCIERILGRASAASQALKKRLLGVRVCASHLELVGRDHWRAAFPFFQKACAHGCATCKPAVMNLLNARCAPTIFVGDGLSDRYAAADADLVFAKRSLAHFCDKEKIEHVTYDNLVDVAARLEEVVRAFAYPRREARLRA